MYVELSLNENLCYNLMNKLGEEFVIIFSKTSKIPPAIYYQSSKKPMVYFLQKHKQIPLQIKVFATQLEARVFHRDKKHQYMVQHKNEKVQAKLEKIKEMKIHDLLSLPIFKKFIISSPIIEPIPKEIDLRIHSTQAKLKLFHYQGKWDKILYFQQHNKLPPFTVKQYFFLTTLAWGLMDSYMKGVQKVNVLISQNLILQKSMQETTSPSIRQKIAIIQSLQNKFQTVQYLSKDKKTKLS